MQAVLSFILHKNASKKCKQNASRVQAECKQNASRVQAECKQKINARIYMRACARMHACAYARACACVGVRAGA